MVVEGLDTIPVRDLRGGLNTQLIPYLIGDNQVADVENLLFTDFGAPAALFSVSNGRVRAVVHVSFTS